MHFGSKNAPICSRKHPAASLYAREAPATSFEARVARAASIDVGANPATSFEAREARAASIDVGVNPAAGLFVGNPKNAERDEVPRRWLEGVPVRLARPNCRTERSVMPRRHSEQRRTRFAIIVLALASRSHRIDRLTRSG